MVKSKIIGRLIDMMYTLSKLSLIVLLHIAFKKGIWASDPTVYEDLKELNVSCYPDDSCKESRTYDSPGILSDYRCSCDSRCVEFGTCCIDSPYRNQLPAPMQCRSVHLPISSHATGYYMVHKCPDDSEDSLLWKSLCDGEWNGDDDLMNVAPVISLDTGKTYKNYYCFRCHETTSDFLYWDLLLQGHYHGSDTSNQEDYSVSYNQTDNTWIATMSDRDISFPVSLIFVIPRQVENTFTNCNPKIISDCSASWTDKSVQSKCNSYSALLFTRFKTFKNAHCALCNFQSLDELSCKEHPPFIIRKIFSFTHLIDVNKSNGDKVEKVDRCEANHIWDPYIQKCRKLGCAIQKYVIIDGQCSPP